MRTEVLWMPGGGSLLMESSDSLSALTCPLEVSRRF